jgi:hypothetical protein
MESPYLDLVIAMRYRAVSGSGGLIEKIVQFIAGSGGEGGVGFVCSSPVGE